MATIGFGGGCHWCTEAYFQQLKGVDKVEQGWIKSKTPYDSFSEAVIVHYDSKIISLEALIQIHLNTHSSTANHSMRSKYRSAIYFFDEPDRKRSEQALVNATLFNKRNYVTQVLPFVIFKENKEEYLQYFEKHKESAFCKTYIDPKIDYLKKEFPTLLMDKHGIGKIAK